MSSLPPLASLPPVPYLVSCRVSRPVPDIVVVRFRVNASLLEPNQKVRPAAGPEHHPPLAACVCHCIVSYGLHTLCFLCYHILTSSLCYPLLPEADPQATNCTSCAGPPVRLPVYLLASALCGGGPPLAAHGSPFLGTPSYSSDRLRGFSPCLQAVRSHY